MLTILKQHKEIARSNVGSQIWRLRVLKQGLGVYLCTQCCSHVCAACACTVVYVVQPAENIVQHVAGIVRAQNEDAYVSAEIGNWNEDRLCG